MTQTDQLTDDQLAEGRRLCEQFTRELNRSLYRTTPGQRDNELEIARGRLHLWTDHHMPAALNRIERMRDTIEAALGAMGEHPDSPVDLAQRISDIRDEGRGHFHDLTKANVTLAEQAREIERLKSASFADHLEQCAAEVAKWPEWKRKLLGDDPAAHGAPIAPRGYIESYDNPDDAPVQPYTPPGDPPAPEGFEWVRDGDGNRVSRDPVPNTGEWVLSHVTGKPYEVLVWLSPDARHILRKLPERDIAKPAPAEQRVIAAAREWREQYGRSPTLLTKYYCAKKSLAYAIDQLDAQQEGEH